MQVIANERSNVLTFINDWINVREEEMLTNAQNLSRSLDDKRTQVIKAVESLKLGEIMKLTSEQLHNVPSQQPAQNSQTAEQFTNIAPEKLNDNILMDESIDIDSANNKQFSKIQQPDNFQGFDMSSSGYAAASFN